MTPTRPPGDPTAAASAVTPGPREGEAGKFTEGSTLRHVLVMTATGSVGLMAIFVVDLLNLFYISLLGEQELAAAIGYAGTILFFMTSVSIGITIGITALVSRALGARDRAAARRLGGSGFAFMALAMVLLTIVAYLTKGEILTFIGATGRTHALADRFLVITLPSNVLLGLGMASSGLLRAVGDAQRAMWVTLSAGLVAAVADPILIFGFGLGLDGAAHAMNLARVVLVFVGLYGAMRIHDLVARPRMVDAMVDLRALGAIAGPAVLTNIATPVANAYVTAALAPFGDAAVAAWAVIGRLVPVAFGVIFALSGSIGPILGQNLGAKRLDRVRRTLLDSLIVVAIYVAAMWVLLVLSRHAVVDLFRAGPDAGALIRFFIWTSWLWLFMGALFVSNAAFNTLGAPLHATLFNWGRATLGTVPFVMIGARFGGAEGVVLGQMLGGVLFGVGAVIVAFRLVDRLSRTS